MKTLGELIEILKTYTADNTNEFLQIKDDILYYLEAYKDFVDNVVKIIIDNKELIQMILADFANETITETEKLLKEYNKINEDENIG